MRNPSTPLSAAALILLFAFADPSAAQVRNRDGGDDGGAAQAVPRSGAQTPAPAPAAAPASEAQAAPRTAPRTGDTTESRTPAAAQRNQGGRARGDRPVVGTAVPRNSAPRSRTVIVAPQARYYRGYSPWGFGGVGFGSYYGSFYDPYVFYDPFSPWYGSYGRYGGYGVYGYPAYGYPSIYAYPPDGDLRLQVKPRDAEVFVDGYYVGIVDDFDGVFQRLHLPSGPHRIELRAPGYETLTVDVQIRFGETTKFEKDMQRIR